MSDPRKFACPHCGQAVMIDPELAAQPLACPHCGGEFLAPGEGDLADLPKAVLDAIRVRQLAAGRRATYRARSYCIIAAFFCAVTVIELIWMIIQQARAAGWGARCTGYLLFSALAIYGLVYFANQARRLLAEVKKSNA